MKNPVNQCSHGNVKLLGEQKGEKGTNKYQMPICGSILVLSEDGVLYQIPIAEKDSSH